MSPRIRAMICQHEADSRGACALRFLLLFAMICQLETGNAVILHNRIILKHFYQM